MLNQDILKFKIGTGTILDRPYENKIFWEDPEEIRQGIVSILKVSTHFFLSVASKFESPSYLSREVQALKFKATFYQRQLQWTVTEKILFHHAPILENSFFISISITTVILSIKVPYNFSIFCCVIISCKVTICYLSLLQKKILHFYYFLGFGFSVWS